MIVAISFFIVDRASAKVGCCKSYAARIFRAYRRQNRHEALARRGGLFKIDDSFGRRYRLEPETSQSLVIDCRIEVQDLPLEIDWPLPFLIMTDILQESHEEIRGRGRSEEQQDVVLQMVVRD
jgi:hypothetical protein